MPGKRLFLSAVIALGLHATSQLTIGSASAQTYPDKPIKLVVPFPPGGPTDYVARLVAQHLSVNLGQVVIDNRPGAGGTIASKSVAGSDPDGYTLLYGSSATLGIAPALYKNADYDPVRSFAPIALVSRVPFVLGIAATLPPTHARRVHRLCQGQSGQIEFRRQHRNATAPGRGIVQGHDRNRHIVRPLQRGRAGDDGSAGRANAHDHRGCDHAAAAHSIRQGEATRRHVAAAPSRSPGRADHDRKRLHAISARVLDGRAGARRAPRQRWSPSSTLSSTRACNLLRSKTISPGSARKRRSDRRRTSRISSPPRRRNGRRW